MRLRGRRECTACGERWSYFQTGDIECPACGGIRSAAVGTDPARHTAGRMSLDLTAARAAVEERPLEEVARLSAEASREFLPHRGFIDAGELRALDDRSVGAAVLREVADQIRRSLAANPAAEWHLVDLLSSVPEGELPADVPGSFHAAWARGMTTAADRYRGDVVRYLEDTPDPEARRLLGVIRNHLRRVAALEGAVQLETAELLVSSVRAVGHSLRGEDGSLADAETCLAAVERTIGG